MTKGYIYIMTNPCLQDMVKIGYSTDVEKRRKQLSTTALPFEYEVYATYETVGNLEDKKLHELIDNLNPHLRVAKDREFFSMTAEEAYRLLESIAIISGTRGKIKKLSVASLITNIKNKRSCVNFAKCNIPIGAELIFAENPNVKAIVIDERRVEYNNEITFLSTIAKNIKGYSVSGYKCFTYNGKTISDIAEETQWKD